MVSSSASSVARPRYSWLVVALLVICVLVEAFLVMGDFNILALPRLRMSAYEYAGFWPGLLGSWKPNYPAQPYVMFLSYAFLHGGLMHLGVNMLTLWSLGHVVYSRVGNRGLAILYGASVFGGALGFGLLTKTIQPMVGASGGLFGLAGGILAWNYVDRFTAAARLWPVLQGVLMLFLLNLVLWYAMGGLLAWETHLGGFVAGWITAMLIDPRGQNDLLEDEPPEDGPGAHG